MKKAMVVCLMLMCTACAPVATKVDVPDMAKSDSLSVRDLRPVSEKDRKIFSLLITSKEYGILRTGDARLSPSPVRLLQYQAFQKFNVSGHAPEVDVQHFVVYQNMKSQLRSGAFGAAVGGVVGGVIGNALAKDVAMAQTKIVDEKAFESYSNEEYQRGLFTEDENPERAPVYIVYIDTDIAGRKVFTRTIAPIRKQGDQDPLANAVQLAIKNHLSNYDRGAPMTATTAPAVITETMPTSDTDRESTTAQPSQPSVGAVMTSTSAAAMPAQSSAGDAAVTAMAQGVATQLGCGMVQANGDSAFTAPCGTYAVLIDCSGNHCHPMHTISTKGNE